jgi:hypothetical protein
MSVCIHTFLRPAILKPVLFFFISLPANAEMVQIIQPTRCDSFTSLLLEVYVWLNMFRKSPRPSSGAQNCTRSLWIYSWREAVGTLLVVVWPDHDQQRSNRFLPTLHTALILASEFFVVLYVSSDVLVHCV